MKVQFYIDAIKDDDKSNEAGYDVYREVEKVRISGFMNGDQVDNGQRIDTIAGAQHKQRFPDEYRKFKLEQKEPAPVGTPIKMWAAVGIAEVKTLASLGITSVEQLAEVEAKELRQYEWLKPLHEKAATWIRSRTDDGEVLRLEARVRQLEAQLEAKTEEAAALLTSLTLARAEPKKRTAKAAD